MAELLSVALLKQIFGHSILKHWCGYPTMNTRVVHFYFDLDQTEIPHGSKMPELAQGGTTVLGGELLIFGGVILSPTGIKFQDKLYGFPLKNIPLFSGTNFHYFFFFFFL
jgi:hypothetical protein